MGFDLVTFIAQIVNLFVLVWLLKRFLYHPILEVIVKRQQEIRDKVQAAEDMRSDAEKERKKWEKEKNIYELEHQKELSQISQELDKKRKEGLTEIKASLQRQRLKMQNDLLAEMAALHTDIGHFIATDFVNLASVALQELSGCCPLDQALNLFLKKIRTLEKSEIKKINIVIQKQKLILINSSKVLTKKQIKETTQVLQKTFCIPSKCKIKFNIIPELILGIEMRTGDISLDWNIKAYLDILNANLDATVANLIAEK